MRCVKSVLLALLVGIASNAWAQSWPVKPVRVVVPFAPGGTVDVLTRFLGERLSTALGQPVLVDNRPGAGGNLGTEAVVRAPADGYTLLLSGSPTHAVNPHLYKNLSYDPLRDTTPIALIGTAPNLLVVNPALPVNSVEDLVKLARAKPGELAYSSAGNGTSGHLAAELLRSSADIDIRHVPYKGQADAIAGVMRGDVAFAFVTVPGTLPQVTAGRLRAIAITSLARSALAPDVPTLAQSGIADFEVLGWYALYGPRGTPVDIVSRLDAELAKIMQEPATRERLTQLGAEPRYLTAQPFVDFMAKESAKWGKVIRESGATAN